jgi:integration host factor subunit alpha
MTKSDIAENIHSKIGVSKRESVDMLELVLSVMKETLETGEKIKVAGFGNFEVKQKKDRIGRNPETGESMTIEARKVLSFKPSAVLKERINKIPATK